MNKIFIFCLTISALIFPAASAQNEPMRNPFLFGAGSDYNKADNDFQGKFMGVSVILILKDRKLAMINGHMLSIGDTINKALITDIAIDSVTVLKNGKTKSYMAGSVFK